MTPERERRCQHIPLTQKPLVMVLCQIQFSPIRQLDRYIGAIQERFRRMGLPIERVGKVRQITFGQAGAQPDFSEETRWEYLTRDQHQSVLLTERSLVLQTADYERFEVFAERLQTLLDVVFCETEHDQHGVVERIGLRYVDAVLPRPGEDFRHYVREGLHGVADDVFLPGTHRAFWQSAGATSIGNHQGVLMLRVSQNDQGALLPADLIEGAPQLGRPEPTGTLITLIDMDHFIEDTLDANADALVPLAYAMHDDIINAFHHHVATPEAIAIWK